MTETPELLPCPFCGNIDALMIEQMPNCVRSTLKVLCDNCGASTGYSDRGDHVNEWNTRAPPKAEPTGSAPETIWADFYDKRMDEGEFLTSFTKGKLPQHQIPYTRTDLHQAALATARNDALEEAAKVSIGLNRWGADKGRALKDNAQEKGDG